MAVLGTLGGIVVAAAGFAQTVTPEVRQLIETGTAAQQQGRHDEAIAAFQKITALLPDLAAAHVNLGSAHMRKGDWPGAIAPFKRALALNPALVGAEQMLGYALAASGYAAEAVPLLEKVKAVDALGIAQLKLGRYSEAIRNLEAALAQRPNDPDLLYYLGRAGALLSKQALETLHAAAPGSARAHQVLGETNAVLNKTVDAEREYREALRIAPGILGVHLELGELHAAAGDWVKAEAAYREESRRQPGDAEAAYRWGAALLELGRVKEARAELARAASLGPVMAETQYALGKAAFVDGDNATAEKAWLKVIELEPASNLAAQSHFGLAGLYRKQGSTAKADEAMRAFRKLQRK